MKITQKLADTMDVYKLFKLPSKPLSPEERAAAKTKLIIRTVRNVSAGEIRNFKTQKTLEQLSQKNRAYDYDSHPPRNFLVRLFIGAKK